jgi:hypothetical protein
MKTQELNPVSSPDQAGLKTLEKPRFLTPSQSEVTPSVPTPRESTTPQIRTLLSCRSRGHETHYSPCDSLKSTRFPRKQLRLRSIPAVFSLCNLHSALDHSDGNHHDSPQPTPSWTAVAPYRFPIFRNPLTLPKAHPQPHFLPLCVFAPLREAFLSRFSPGMPSVFLRFWTLVLLIASTAGCTSKNIFSLNQQSTTPYTP